MSITSITSSPTISHLLSLFLRTKKSTQTQRAYSADIHKFFVYIGVSSIDELQATPIHAISTAVIERTDTFKKTDTYRTDRILNPRTVNRKAYAVSSFFEYLVAHYGYPRNPIKVYIPHSTPAKTSTTDLSHEESEALWTYATRHLDTIDTKSFKKQLTTYQSILIIGFLMMSLRRNEVATLMRRDRDRTQNVITVTGKGQKIKYIPLPSSLSVLLVDFWSLKQNADHPSDYIFSPLSNTSTNNASKPITGSYIYGLIVKYVDALKITGDIDVDKQITPHSFRTTFVKFALEKKYSDIEIMNATGHSTSAMIKYYDSRSPIEANAANMMHDMFG